MEETPVPSSGIWLGGDLLVPEADLEWRFATSGGPGGQHANRSQTRVELRVDLRRASLPADVAEKLISRLGRRARRGVVSVTVDESRSQWRNREIAKERLGELLRGVLVEAKPRRRTRPTRRSRERRLRGKRRRSEIKQLRKPPPPE
jgi:ribosome-associated protein